MKQKRQISLFILQLFFTFFISAVCIYSQVETIPADHPVYSFLKQMQVKGIINNYDDVVLPLSKQQVVKYLLQIDSASYKISNTEKDYLYRLEEKLDIEKTGVSRQTDIFDDFPSSFIKNISSDTEKHIYSYKDSSISFYTDPIIEADYIYSSGYKNNSTLLNLGGIFRGSYGGWLGFYFMGSNGSVLGNRETARLDKRVEQSFTFNHTGINYFDETSGYLRLQKGIVSVELGRERVLWGNGYISRAILSDNPQMFDFVRFDIAYKKFRYDFLHGWLVQTPQYVFIDSLSGYQRVEQPKYIAVSRIGYAPNEKLSLGATQMIIYSGRPFEAAYLNPFLFWESAQRSMNDLDNSFISFDGRYKIINGMESSASIIFDDINFSYIFHNGWDRYNNGVEWQAGIMLTDPILFADSYLKLEYLQIRPYTFSHPGGGEALTYTNNGYMLGTDLQPNSACLSADFGYRFSSKLELNLLYSHSIHGNNIYDANGNLVTNYGGNVFRNFASAYDAQYVSLIEGNRETTDMFKLNLNYEVILGYYFNLSYEYFNSTADVPAQVNNILTASFKVDFR